MHKIYEAYKQTLLSIYEKEETFDKGLDKFYNSVIKYITEADNIDLRLHKTHIAKYTKNYSNLYRVWTGINIDEFNQLGKMRRSVLSVTTSTKGLSTFIEHMYNLGHEIKDNPIITKQSGKGINSVDVLFDAIEYIEKHKDYTIMNLNDAEGGFDLANQADEIILINPKKPTQKDIYGYYDLENSKVIKMTSKQIHSLQA